MTEAAYRSPGVWCLTTALLLACCRSSVARRPPSDSDRLGDTAATIAGALPFAQEDSEWPPYTGHGPEGIPHYANREFSVAERALLRRVYGVENPNRLYVSDSSEDGLLKYDTEAKRCATCYVNSYRIGLVSVRRPGESWEQLERRTHSMRARDFPTAARITSSSTADLDPAIRADVEQMLADAQRAGFVLHVKETYRSPEREAYLMAVSRGHTHTLTSLHSYGRAIDVVIGDGNLRRAATRARWIAFRKWVTTYKADEFRILGAPDRTWDWAHVEVPSPTIGFRTIEDAITRAQACSASTDRPVSCDFTPHLR